MSSSKITTLEKAKSEVLKICDKYKVVAISCEEKETPDTMEFYLTIDTEDEEVFDKIYTRCGFLNEERCTKDLSVTLCEPDVKLKEYKQKLV